MIARGDQLLTSTLTLREILVKPLDQGDDAVPRRYEQALSRGAVLVPFNAEAARVCAGLRRDRALREPDAIQLACAAQARADLFLTNDEGLSHFTVPGIQFVASLERVPL